MDVMILRFITPTQVVARLSTGVVGMLHFQHPIHMQYLPMARQTTPFAPVVAKIQLGTYDERVRGFQGCILVQAAWPKPASSSRKKWF